MTKEQFLNGTSFRIKEGVTNTYKVQKTNSAIEQFYIVEEIRLSDGTVITTHHHANISEMNDKGFKAYSYVLEKGVKVNLKFKDLIEA